MRSRRRAEEIRVGGVEGGVEEKRRRMKENMNKKKYLMGNMDMFIQSQM